MQADTGTASMEYGEPGCPYADETNQRTVWYSITPPAGSRVVVTGESSTMGVVLAVYSGDALKELTYHACNYRSSPGRTRTVWITEAGNTYYLQVGGYDGAGGLVDLHVHIPPPPANDNRAAAIAVPYPPSPFSDVIEEVGGATTEPGEPAPSCFWLSPSRSTVWYVLQTPESGGGDYVFDALGSGGYPGLAVWKALPDASLEEALCLTYQPKRMMLEPATTYYIQLVEQGSSWAGSGRVQLNISDPIANDDFANAASLAVGETQTLDAIRATREPGEPRPSCVSSLPPTVWYRFTASSDMVLGLHATTGEEGWPQGWIAAYAGAELSTLHELSCKSVGEAVDGLELRAGESVFLQAGHYYSNSSVVHVGLSILPKAANDDPQGARALSPLPLINTSLSEVTTNARLDEGEPIPTCGPQDRSDVGTTTWYAATFATTEQRILSTSSSYDTVLQIFDGDTVSPEPLACNDDASGSTTASSITFTFQMGKRYLIEVAGIDRRRGSLTLLLQLPPAPPLPRPANDDFDHARAIGEVPYADAGDTTGATLQATEPQPSADCVATPTDPKVNNTIWYAFTPERDMTLQMTVAGNTLNTLVAAYTGPSLEALTQVACTGAVTASGQTARVQVASFPATAGVTYYFQVGRRGTSNTGPAPFQLHELPGEAQ